MSVAKYWRETPRRYRLEAAKCTGCGKVLFPARLICPECKGRNFETVQLAPQGKLITYTIIHVAPGDFTDQLPYAVGIVELDDGVRLLTQISDCDPQVIQTGMDLKLEFRRISSMGHAGIHQYGYKAVPVS